MTMTEQLTLMPQQRPGVKVINFLLRHARWRKAWAIFHGQTLYLIWSLRHWSWFKITTRLNGVYQRRGVPWEGGLHQETLSLSFGSSYLITPFRLFIVKILVYLLCGWLLSIQGMGPVYLQNTRLLKRPEEADSTKLFWRKMTRTLPATSYQSNCYGRSKDNIIKFLQKVL